MEERAKKWNVLEYESEIGGNKSQKWNWEKEGEWGRKRGKRKITLKMINFVEECNFSITLHLISEFLKILLIIHAPLYCVSTVVQSIISIPFLQNSLYCACSPILCSSKIASFIFTENTHYNFYTSHTLQLIIEVKFFKDTLYYSCSLIHSALQIFVYLFLKK